MDTAGTDNASSHPRPRLRGLLCRCSVCGREERAGESPLRNGWPSCHGYTMTLIDTKRFIDGMDSEIGAIFASAPRTTT
jgi:hypothetical protein